MRQRKGNYQNRREKADWKLTIWTEEKPRQWIYQKSRRQPKPPTRWPCFHCPQVISTYDLPLRNMFRGIESGSIIHHADQSFILSIPERSLQLAVRSERKRPQGLKKTLLTASFRRKQLPSQTTGFIYLFFIAVFHDLLLYLPLLIASGLLSIF